MNTILPCLVLLALSGTALALPVPINGSTTYTQNFDSLGTVDIPWVNDSAVLPGWYAQINNGNTASGNLQATSGTVDLSGLINAGTDADRAIGTKSTSTGGFANASIAVLFQNTGTTPVALSNLSYTGELWRANTTAGTVENFTLFYQVSNSPITNVLSGGSSATAAAGAGFTALDFAANWALSNSSSSVELNGNDPANRLAVSFTPPTSISVGPGRYLMLKWTDSNGAGTDGFQAIDDLSVQFTEISGLVEPLVSNITRDLNSTPGDPFDDTFGFTLKVTGTGSVGAGWNTVDANPPAGNASSASYGASVVWTGFPVFIPKVITVSDSSTPALNATLTVNPPRIIGTNDLVTPTPLLSNGGEIFSWLIDDAARTLTQNSETSQADFVVDSEVIDLSTTGFATFTAEMDYMTGSSSGFEAADSFALQLIIDGGPPVSVLGAADTNNDGRLTGTVELPATTNVPATPVLFSYLIPDTANSVQVRIIGNSNSPNETYIVKDIRLSPPPATLFAQIAGAPTTISQGTVDPSDDTFTVPVTVQAVGLGGSTGWHSDEVPARTGFYSDPNPVIFGPYRVIEGVRFVTLMDDQNAAVMSPPLTFTPPVSNVYVIGQVNLGGGLTNLFSDPATTSSPEWVNDPAARTLTMFAGIATDSVVTSQTLDLSAVGAVQFTATLQLTESSTGTNLETTDRFKAELIIDGTIHNLVSSLDTGDGAGATTVGANGAPNGYINGYTGAVGTDLVTNVVYATEAEDYSANKSRDEFNLVGAEVGDVLNATFPLNGSIPASANSVQVKIYGTGFAGSETAVVSDILFVTGPPAGGDADGDGVNDTDEAIQGTDPNNAADVLRLSQSPTQPTQINFPSKSGRFYRVYSSANLSAWVDTGVPTIAGDGSEKQFNITTTSGPHQYYRLHVMGADGPWPATYP